MSLGHKFIVILVMSFCVQVIDSHSFAQEPSQQRANYTWEYSAPTGTAALVAPDTDDVALMLRCKSGRIIEGTYPSFAESPEETVQGRPKGTLSVLNSSGQVAKVAGQLEDNIATGSFDLVFYILPDDPLLNLLKREGTVDLEAEEASPPGNLTKRTLSLAGAQRSIEQLEQICTRFNTGPRSDDKYAFVQRYLPDSWTLAKERHWALEPSEVLRALELETTGLNLVDNTAGPVSSGVGGEIAQLAIYDSYCAQPPSTLEPVITELKKYFDSDTTRSSYDIAYSTLHDSVKAKYGTACADIQRMLVPAEESGFPLIRIATEIQRITRLIGNTKFLNSYADALAADKLLAARHKAEVSPPNLEIDDTLVLEAVNAPYRNFDELLRSFASSQRASNRPLVSANTIKKCFTTAQAESGGIDRRPETSSYAGNSRVVLSIEIQNNREGYPTIVLALQAKSFASIWQHHPMTRFKPRATATDPSTYLYTCPLDEEGKLQSYQVYQFTPDAHPDNRLALIKKGEFR